MQDDYRPDAGTRSFLDIVLFRHRDTPYADQQAVLRGEGRKVSCFARSAFEPLPRKFRQGFLYLDPDSVAWASGMRGGGALVELKQPIQVSRVRPVGAREWRVKSGVFQVIEAETRQGPVELAVPTVSVDLVVGLLDRS